MIKELINLANELDRKGLRKEADYLDSITKGAGADDYHDFFGPGEKIDLLAGKDAKEVATMLVGGSPITGPDADHATLALTNKLKHEDHTATVKVIMDFFSKMKPLHKGDPPKFKADVMATDPDDVFDPYKDGGSPERVSGEDPFSPYEGHEEYLEMLRNPK